MMGNLRDIPEYGYLHNSSVGYHGFLGLDEKVKKLLLSGDDLFYFVGGELEA